MPGAHQRAAGVFGHPPLVRFPVQRQFGIIEVVGEGIGEEIGEVVGWKLESAPLGS